MICYGLGWLCGLMSTTSLSGPMGSREAQTAASDLKPNPRLASPTVLSTVECAVIEPFLFCQSQTAPGPAQIFSTTSNASLGCAVPDTVLGVLMPVRRSVAVTVSAASTSVGVTLPVPTPALKPSENVAFSSRVGTCVAVLLRSATPL